MPWARSPALGKTLHPKKNNKFSNRSTPSSSFPTSGLSVFKGDFLHIVDAPNLAPQLARDDAGTLQLTSLLDRAQSPCLLQLLFTSLALRLLALGVRQARTCLGQHLLF